MLISATTAFEIAHISGHMLHATLRNPIGP